MRNLLLLLLGCFLSIATISAQSLTISQEKIKRSPYEQVEIGIAGFGINEDLSSNQTDYLEQFWIMYHLFVPVMKHISLGANYTRLSMSGTNFEDTRFYRWGFLLKYNYVYKDIEDKNNLILFAAPGIYKSNLYYPYYDELYPQTKANSYYWGLDLGLKVRITGNLYGKAMFNLNKYIGAKQNYNMGSIGLDYNLPTFK